MSFEAVSAVSEDDVKITDASDALSTETQVSSSQSSRRPTS